MLLPSLSFACDGPPQTRHQSAREAFASPPSSPPAANTNTHPTIYSACRTLHSILTPPPTHLPSPPLTTHDSPSRLRLRARRSDDTPANLNLTPRKRISKRAAPPPRGLNKRRRTGHDETNRATPEQDEGADLDLNSEAEPAAPSTPKRARLAPEQLPLGLQRSDFHALHLQQQLGVDAQNPQPEKQNPQPGKPNPQPEKDGEADAEWTPEDDAILVELVLEKLKLSKSEWQDCARSLGRERGSVGRRWRSLVAGGEVGLKGRLRARGRICATWR